MKNMEYIRSSSTLETGIVSKKSFYWRTVFSLPPLCSIHRQRELSLESCCYASSRRYRGKQRAKWDDLQPYVYPRRGMIHGRAIPLIVFAIRRIETSKLRFNFDKGNAACFTRLRFHVSFKSITLFFLPFFFLFSQLKIIIFYIFNYILNSPVVDSFHSKIMKRNYYFNFVIIDSQLEILSLNSIRIFFIYLFLKFWRNIDRLIHF